MAGAGYKLFNTGDVLLASEVNTYLQQQVTMVFANAAARTSALSAVLAEGMMSYLQDTNSVEVYNGTSWVNVGNAGDITEVQAGTGISVASGTGPIPVVTNTVATTFDAKGDLVVGTGADTFAKLSVGTNGYTLVADSSTSTGLKWAAPAGGGKVLQVVQGTTTTYTTSSSSTFADTNLSQSITPTSATSKILVLVSQNGVTVNSTDVQAQMGMRLMRDSTELSLFIENAIKILSDAKAGGYSIAFNYLDSPNTTSATTYKTQFRMVSGYDGRVQDYATTTNKTMSTITLMEIGA